MLSVSLKKIGNNWCCHYGYIVTVVIAVSLLRQLTLMLICHCVVGRWKIRPFLYLSKESTNQMNQNTQWVWVMSNNRWEKCNWEWNKDSWWICVCPTIPGRKIVLSDVKETWVRVVGNFCFGRFDMKMNLPLSGGYCNWRRCISASGGSKRLLWWACLEDGWIRLVASFRAPFCLIDIH